MSDRYIIIGKNKEAYKHSYTYDLSVPSHFVVEGTMDYDSARMFRSLRWATHRARQLTRKSGSAYYVYLQITVDDKNYYHIVDEHINDDIFEERQKLNDEINQIISDWKAKNGRSKVVR